ncbi:MAG TPA: MASE3 domain-containing protein, partial [Telluria sp.]|nr:MASE3 domain-containing protein [Telluria sp.]
SFDGRTPRGVALLSPAFLAVGLLDFAHLMSVAGMPGLDAPGTVEKGIAFWLPARGIAALALLAAALAPEQARAGRGTRRVLLALALAASALGYWLALARPDLLPATFVPGRGLTGFKVGSEYAFMAVSALAALLLLRRARANSSAANWYLVTAAAINAISVVSFTLYRDADDIFNLAGHVYKVFMDLCLYRAIFVVAVQDPYLRLRRSERSLFESETRFRSLMEAAPDAIVMSDARGRIAMMNACAESLFGVPRRAAAGIPVEALVPPDEGSDEVACRRAHGDPFPAEVRRSRVSSSGEELDIAIVRDLSERRKLEKALLEQLTHDALTGLPNRRRILEALAEAIAAARVGGHMLAVLVFDIDQFKKVNNSFGYADGDAVLRECVRRISSALRPGDTLARQGGNEFIILQKNVAREAEVAALADTLLARMREPFSPRGQQVFLSASVGIALMPQEEVRPQELLHRAQVAMGVARAEGAGRCRFHTGEMERSLRERVSLEAFLRHAVERRELAVQYQPRVSMKSGEMVGVEALVRWRHPTLGLVPPGRFIPIAEETG